MSNDILKWDTTGIRLTPEGTLIIEANPHWENKKRWEGEMEFLLSSQLLEKLQRDMQQRYDKGRMREIAQAELIEFVTNMKTDYLQKKKTVAEQLGLSMKEMPHVCWYQLDCEDTKTVEIECE